MRNIWGQVDILWTVIFLVIIAFFIYWTILAFTEKRSQNKSTNNSKSILSLEELEEIDDAEYEEIEYIDDDDPDIIIVL
jgi:pyruvate/2-oxoacid:ferredoxin oxidoreductase alpha subunit